MTPNDRLLSRQEVQEKLGVSRSSIYRMLEAGTLPPPLELGPRLLRWRSKDVEAIMSGDLSTTK